MIIDKSQVSVKYEKTGPENGCAVTVVEILPEIGSGLDAMAKKVIVAVGTRADKRLYEQIKSLDLEICQVGDCLGPGTTKSANYQSAVLGRKI